MAWLSAHAAYVAAAFGIAFALLGAELALLRRRWRAAEAHRP